MFAVVQYMLSVWIFYTLAFFVFGAIESIARGRTRMLKISLCMVLGLFAGTVHVLWKVVF